MGDRLGPVLWQFAPTKKFDEADFGAFLDLLPRTFDGVALRHVVEVRHDSFCNPDFIALLRKQCRRGLCRPSQVPGDFGHNLRFRLRPAADRQGYGQDCLPAQGAGCLGEAIDALVARRRARRPPRSNKTSAKKVPRDVFAYVIHEGKIRAPAGAMELIERVK
jgi:uncharacterized protein YecE (DUF72 family)